MSPEDFAARFDVPRGTLQRLEAYEAALRDWQGRMNLVAPSTLEDIWGRHFADSAQLAALAPTGATWLDMGAGGGFPGLVLAAMGVGRLHLVESVGKKCAFLRAAAQALGVADAVTVHQARVEALPPLRADVITARACAPLRRLFDWGLPHSTERSVWLLPKGARHGDELREAQDAFAFTHTLAPSMTNAEARIVVAQDVRRRR